jgi:hypothetical protein
MIKLNKKYLGITLVAALLIWFMVDALSQPGVKDLKGDFREMAFYRNENNTGPIVRIYSVTVADTLWGEMEQYGNYMPHTKYGNTKVYFFRQGSPAPEQIYPGKENFSGEMNKYCLAMYEKDAMGNIIFRKYPFL